MYQDATACPSPMICANGLLSESNTSPSCHAVSWTSVIGSDYLILVAERDGSSLENQPLDVSIHRNDECANASPVTAQGGSRYTATTIDANVSSNVTTCASIPSGPGLWYTVQGTGGDMRASTCEGTVIDTQLSVFQGTSCDTLECVDGNDNACATQSAVLWASQSDKTYYILVHATSPGTFSLSLEGESREGLPPNERCANPEIWEISALADTYIDIAIPLDRATLDSEINIQTQSCGLSSWIDRGKLRGLWYSVDGTGGTMGVNWKVDDSAHIAAYTGGCVDLRCATDEVNVDTANAATISWESNPGEPYLIYVSYQDDAYFGNFSLTLWALD